MASYQESKKFAVFNKFETALGAYKHIISEGGGDIKEVIQRLLTALLRCVACDAFNNETRNEPLVERYCLRSITELSQSLAKLFPPSSVSVASRNQALKDAKEVFDKWGSDFRGGSLPEEAEEALLMNLRKPKAQEGKLFVGVTVILTEFQHLNKDFEELLEDKEIRGGK
jgi:hypothetical protein